MAQPGLTKIAAIPEPPAYFGEALEDAERLLKYSAETGIDVDGDTRDHILQARVATTAGWDEATASNMLTALARLAALLKPVTAGSLKACSEETRPTVRTYWLWAIGLLLIIVPFSVASFVASAISNTIRTDITTANGLAVKLSAQLGPPPGVKRTASPATDASVIADLQQYAATIRTIYARALQLHVLMPHAERDPFYQTRKDQDTDPDKVRQTFQLPPGLPDFSVAADGRTKVYQDVRYFAQNLVEDVSFWYGAISVCLLPIVYALLGTFAYLLRTFQRQMTTRTFIPSGTNSARFLVAAIGGAVVGLFNNFIIGQGVSVPPLALAFLVGYAVDVFFAFLEGMLQSFTKTSASSPAAASGGNG